MSFTKSQKRTNEIIQREQKQLLMIQKELEDILTKVNDSINVLKVEEFQLKSSAVVSENMYVKTEKTIESPLQIIPAVSSSLQQSGAMETQINRQQVDLDLGSIPYTRQQDIEEDDD